MTCEDVRANSIVEKYLTGRLSEGQRQEFEDHYASCDGCFRDVESLSAIKEELQRYPRTRIARRSPRWQWALAAAATLAIGGILLFEMRPHGAGPAAHPVVVANPLAELAQFDPPAWPDVRFRDAAPPEEASFRSAREAYLNHDWKLCTSSLANAAVPSRHAVEAEFYLAICRLSGGDAPGAASALRHVISAGDTPYLEEAHYYLAKSLLAQNDSAGARRELSDTVALHGDLEDQAAALLARIR